MNIFEMNNKESQTKMLYQRKIDNAVIKRIAVDNVSETIASNIVMATRFYMAEEMKIVDPTWREIFNTILVSDPMYITRFGGFGKAYAEKIKNIQKYWSESIENGKQSYDQSLIEIEDAIYHLSHLNEKEITISSISKMDIQKVRHYRHILTGLVQHIQDLTNEPDSYPNDVIRCDHDVVKYLNEHEGYAIDSKRY